MNVKNSIDRFLGENGKNKGKKPDERYASFDYCEIYTFDFLTAKGINIYTKAKLIDMCGFIDGQ